MADRYWRGGTGTWDSTTTTNWSTTSGGAGGASVPTSADSVFFDQAGSYFVNMAGTINCLSLNMSAGAPYVQGASSVVLNVYGSFSTIGASVTWQNRATINFLATTTGNTINTNSLWVESSVVFNGVGGGWTLLSSYNMRDNVGGASNYGTTLTNGALDLGGFSWSTNSFSSSNTNTRSIAFGSGNINAQPSVQNGTTVLNLTNLTGFSWTGTGAFVTDNGYSITINAPTTGVTISNAPNLTFVGAGVQNPTMSANGTWNNLNYGSIGGSPSYTVNVYGTLTITAGGGNPAGLVANMIGTGNVVNAAAKTISALNINTAGTVTLTNGVTVTTASTLSTNTGTFALNGQTLTCTGAFSHSGGFITFGVGAISCTTFTVSASAAMNFTSGTITASGGFIINSATASFTYTAGTLTIPSFTQTNGTVTLAANVTLPSVVTGTYTLTAGALNLNGFNLTTGIFSSAGGGVRSVAFGSNNIILASTTAGATVLAMATTNNFSFTGTGGFSANMSVTRTFNCGFSSNNPRLFINAGASIPTFSAGSGFETLDFTGSTCTPATVAVNVGSIILATGGTYTGLTVQHRDFDTGAGTITPNGKTIAAFTNITTLNTVTLAGALSCTVFTQTSGTINFATFNLTCSSTASYTAGTMNNIGTISCTTFTNNGAFSFNNGTITPSTSFVNSATGSFTYNSPAVLSAVPTFTHTAGTVTLGKNYALTATGTYTHTAGTLDLGNNTLTTGIFASNSVSTRSIAFGTGFISLAHTTAAQTVLSMATLTGYSWTGTGGFTAAMSVTRTFNIGTSTGGSSTTATNLFITSGASVPTLTAGSYFNILDFTGSTCAPAGTLFNVNTLVLASGGIYNTIGFAPQFNVTQTWTPQFSKQLGGFGVTNNATVTLGGTQNFIMGSVTTLTSGTLNLGGYDFEAKTFSSTNTNTRSIVFGTNNIILNTTTSTTTILSMAIATGFTWTGTGGFRNDGAAGSGYDVPRTFVFGTTGGTTVNAPNLSIFSGSTGNVTITNGSWFNDVNFTGSACTVTGNFNVSTLTLASGGTYTGAGVGIEPQFTRTQTWTPQFSKTIQGFGCNIVGGTLTMGGAQVTDVASTINLTNGTLDLGGFNLTMGRIASNNTNTRSIAFGSNSITLSHATAGTPVLDCANATNFTWTGTGGFIAAMSITRTFTFGTTGGTSTKGPNLSITSGASIPTLTNGSWFNTLNFTGSTCTPASSTVNVNNLILASGGTYTSLNVTMVAAGNITGNGKSVGVLTIQHSSSATTTTLLSAVTCSAGSHVLGILDCNTFTLTCSGTFNTQAPVNSLTNININTATFGVVQNGEFNFTAGAIVCNTSFVVNAPTLPGSFTYNGTATLNTLNTFTQTAGNVTLNKVLALSGTSTYTLNGGILTLGTGDLTPGIFSSTTTTARSIAFGTNNIVLAHTTAGTTVLSFANATGFTKSGTGYFVSNMTLTRTFTFGTTGGTITNAPTLKLISGSQAPTITSGSWFNTLDFTGSTCSPVATTNVITLILASGGTYGSLNPTMVGTGSITSNTKQIATLAIASVNTTLIDNADSSGATTLTSGTLTLNGFTLRTNTFASTNTNVRSIAFGTGNVNMVSATAGVVMLSMANATNFTWTGTGGFTNSSVTSNSLKTFTFGTTGGSKTNAPNLTISSAADYVILTTGSWFNKLDWSGGTATPYIPASTVNLNALTMNSTSWNNLSVNIVGTGTITSNGNTSLNNFTINNPGEIVSLADNFGVSAITTLTAGTLNLNNFNLTSGGAFVSNNANVRQIQFGTGQIICNGTVSALDMANATNFTWTGTGRFSSNTTQNRTFTFGTTGGTSTNAPSLSLISGVNSATLTTGSWFNILNFTGCTGGFTTSTSLNLNSLILDSGGTYTGITATMRGTGTITPNGKTLPALTINTSGTATLAGALIVSGAVTLTSGDLITGYSLTSGSFTSFGPFARSITGSTTTYTISGAGATAWNFGLTTGSALYNTTNQRFSIPASSGFNFSGGTWTIEFWMYSTATPTAGNQCRIFMFGVNATNTALVVGYNNNGTISIAVPFGGIIGGTSATGAITLNNWYHVAVVSNAGTAQIYINGTASGSPVVITQPVSSSPTLFIGYDTFNVAVNFQYQGYITNVRIVNTVAVYTGNFTPSTKPLLPTQSSDTNISAITGTQTSLLLSTPINSITTDYSPNALTVTNNGAITANTFSPFTTSPNINFTGFTISMTSASAKTFSGGGATYPIISQDGSGALTISDSNSFDDIQATTRPSTITFAAGTTTTVSAFTLSGTSGNLVTINSSTPGTRFNLVKTNGVVNTNYLSIQDSFAKGASAYAGSNSTNVSNNLGWTFSSWQPGNFLNFFDYNTSFNYYTDPGQIEWTTPGTYTWTVHEGVTSVSVVCVGGGGGGKSTGNQGGGAGGGLGWKNVSVTPGQVITVVVGAGGKGTGVAPTAGGNSYFLDMSTVYGGGGAAGDGGTTDFLSAGGTFLGDGGGNGGQGGYAAQGEAAGGGGAGGYAGNGGRGGWQPQTTSYQASFTGVAGSGGGGGGGGGKYTGLGYGAGGGGVGIYGQGNNGAAGQQDRDPDGTSRAQTAGGGGSGGQTGFIGSAYSNGGLYGGGGGGGQTVGAGTRSAGADGAVRIIWGTNRSYPSTNTGNV